MKDFTFWKSGLCYLDVKLVQIHLLDPDLQPVVQKPLMNPSCTPRRGAFQNKTEPTDVNALDKGNCILKCYTVTLYFIGWLHRPRLALILDYVI